VFLQFNEQALGEWQSRPEVRERATMLYEGYKKWAGSDAVKLEKFPGPIYYMLHSFSHLLLTAISLECGYPASSLRERIFVSGASDGILIYAGSSDAEGTLGGLVQAGREIRRHVRMALEAGKLCSNHPVCSHHEYSVHDEQGEIASDWIEAYKKSAGSTPSLLTSFRQRPNLPNRAPRRPTVSRR
jgi:hypothetical protein